MAFSIETAKKRAEMMRCIRAFFREKNVLEVETPVMSRSTITDCHIDQFSADYFPCGTGGGEAAETRYLQPSPELQMKRLLAEGFPDIYQICKSFRNGEYGRFHNPEFTMLEWYRIGFDMYRMIDEVELVVNRLTGGVTCTRISYQDLFLRLTGIDPLPATVDTVTEYLRRTTDSPVPAFDDRADAFMYVMSMQVEPQLPKDEVTVVYHYPQDQGVLAVAEPDNPSVARRFEIYYRGMELANGSEELTDADEYARRLGVENKRRIKRGKPLYDAAEGFDASVLNGMSPCSGVAIGLDRLLMCLTGAESIDTVIGYGWGTC